MITKQPSQKIRHRLDSAPEAMNTTAPVTLTLSETLEGLTVQIQLIATDAALQLSHEDHLHLSQNDKTPSEVLDQAILEAHTRLLPLVRQARHQVAASLAKAVLENARDSKS